MGTHQHQRRRAVPRPATSSGDGEIVTLVVDGDNLDRGVRDSYGVRIDWSALLEVLPWAITREGAQRIDPEALLDYRRYTPLPAIQNAHIFWTMFRWAGESWKDYFQRVQYRRFRFAEAGYIAHMMRPRRSSRLEDDPQGKDVEIEFYRSSVGTWVCDGFPDMDPTTDFSQSDQDLGWTCGYSVDALKSCLLGQETSHTVILASSNASFWELLELWLEDRVAALAVVVAETTTQKRLPGVPLVPLLTLLNRHPALMKVVT